MGTLHDDLTGVSSGAFQRAHLELALKRAARSGTHVALLFLDVDGFHAINQRLGHEAGDEVLVQLAARLSGALRSTDVVARLDRDEFVVVCEGLDDPDHVRIVTERIRGVLREPLPIGDGEVAVGVSIGTAVDSGETSPGRMLLIADQRMTRAKARVATLFADLKP